jgi:transposase
MIPISTGVRVWLVTGHTDMRKGFDGLALIVQETLKRDPHSGHLFVFRGRRGSLVKCLGATAKVCACSRSAWSVG